ncbi:contact-dependent growth inhibition system immunity protein [Streptomyces sp. 900105755]
MTRLVDRDRSLEELERDRWPAPTAGASRLVATVHALRRRPIGRLTVEDMRLLIGQNLGLGHLLPLALEVLRVDPMAEGDLYEGDLLSAVVTRSPAVWNEWPELGRELGAIVSELTGLSPSLTRETASFLARRMSGAPGAITPHTRVAARGGAVPATLRGGRASGGDSQH